MNTNPGLIGRKLGTTQIFQEDGTVVPVTAIEAGPCRIVGKRTPDQHGYAAIQVGFGEKSKKKLNKPEAGQFKDGDAPNKIQELRVSAESLDQYEIGQTLRAADVFSEGQFVDVQGTTKGRGFTGVIKRWNFHGAGTVGHGTHESKRGGGSVGMATTPGRTLKGHKMPGQYGAETVSILNLKVAKILADEDVIMVAGGVPGPQDGWVTVRSAVKKKAKPAE